MSRVADNPGASRYELTVDGEQVGKITYERNGDVVDMQHTIVDPERQSEGLGSELVKGALDDARANGLRVRPSCSFVAGYIGDHPEYGDLVAG